jgi:glutamyl-tRNA synthetase
MSAEERSAKVAAGIPYVIRQNNPREGETSFHDELYGDISVKNSELDDMILIKSDGFPTYNFANVVDDHLMQISHVVRGNEYLSSTPKYNRLYQAFGWEIPTYVHLPLITDSEHKKLSKRSGHSSFEELLEQGFLPATVVNFIALLGWSPESNQEIFSLTELVKQFDYRRINKAPAVFDIGKLRWMNGEYLKALDFEAFYAIAAPIITETLGDDFDCEKIAAMVKTRIELWSDIPEMIDFFAELPEYEIEMYSHKKMKTTSESALAVLTEVLPLLEALTDYSNESLYQRLCEFCEAKGYKTGFVMWPLRVAVSGKQTTPAGATEIMSVLGKEESLGRIKKGLALLERKQN